MYADVAADAAADVGDDVGHDVMMTSSLTRLRPDPTRILTRSGQRSTLGPINGQRSTPDPINADLVNKNPAACTRAATRAEPSGGA